MSSMSRLEEETTLEQMAEVKADEVDLLHERIISRGKRSNKLLTTVLGLGLLASILANVSLIRRTNIDIHENDEDDPVVRTVKGSLRGLREHSLGGKSILSFYAIPYAKPPLGKLRFQDPMEEEQWMELRNASRQPEQCLQISFQKLKNGVTPKAVGSEDCLYLNVFTPKVGVSVGLPVMVYLHGGGYVAGAAHHFLPHALLDHQVVLVVPQFRLGTLGFMSTEDDVMPGNYMLKDQLAALRWVHRNIRQFGGDPHRLTLFGESAGGCSTNLLLLSPKSQGLFSRAILHSGTALSPFAFGRRHRQVVEDTARSLGHTGEMDSRTILSFLQTVPVKSLISINTKPDWFVFPGLMGPRVDGDLIPTDPYEMVLNMTCPPWQLMTGLTSHDGALLTFYVYLLEDLKKRLKENFTHIGPLSLMLADDDIDAHTKAATLYQYYLGKDMNFDLMDNLTQFHTDYSFGVPSDLVALAHATCARSHRDTFLFEVSHRGEQSISDLSNATFGKHWVIHGDDLHYLFPVETFRKGLQPLSSCEDITLRNIMTKLWVNFAYTGDPTPDASMGFTWQAVEDNRLNYLDLTPSPTMKPDYRGKIRDFYKTVLPEQQTFLEKLDALKSCMQ